MIKAGYVIYRLGFLDFIKNPELTQLPHLGEHLLQRNFDKILKKDFAKATSGANGLYCITTTKDIPFKDFKSLVNNDNLYILDKKFFEIEKNRILEELYLDQNDIYRFFIEKIFEKLIGLPSAETYLKNYFKFFKNLNFSYVKEFFNKYFNENNRFLYFFKNKELKFFKFPQKDQLIPLPSIKIERKNKFYIKKDKKVPEAISFGLLLDFSIKNLFLLFFSNKLITDIYSQESFYYKINLEKGLTYSSEEIVKYLPQKILALSVIPSSNTKKVEKLFYEFINSISFKNENLRKRFELEKKNFFKVKSFSGFKFLSVILFLSFINNLGIFTNNNFLKDIKRELKKITFGDFISFIKNIQKNKDFFIFEFY